MSEPYWQLLIDENEADDRLKVAAPDLLAALRELYVSGKEMAETVTNRDKNDKAINRYLAAERQAYAAICKAEGHQ